MITIEYHVCKDWGCDHTDADTDAYCEAVSAAIRAAYPDADIDVFESDETSRFARVCIDGTRTPELCDLEEEIEATVSDIASDVWDRGGFWP